MKKNQCLLTVAEVGRALSPQLTPQGVRAAANAGRLRVAIRTAGGIRLFDPADVERFQAGREKTGGPRAA